MRDNLSQWQRGLRDGIPICLGYIAVSFTFGVMARQSGLTPYQAVLMSATNLTSAGQFAALSLISSTGSYLEMAIAQFVINIRYSLMSSALSQKIAAQTPFYHRFGIATGITDEIFGVSVLREGRLQPFYQYGLISISVPGWVLGTWLGTISGDILPARIISALSVALYGMFLAVIIPPARGNKVLTGVIGLSMLLSLALTRLPYLRQISPGMRIILLTVLIAAAAALKFPVITPGPKERARTDQADCT